MVSVEGTMVKSNQDLKDILNILVKKKHRPIRILFARSQTVSYSYEVKTLTM